MEKWEKERKLLIDVFTVKKLHAESESGDEADKKWEKERKILIDGFTVKKLHEESEFGDEAGDFGHAFGEKCWERDMKYYLEPGHRRPRLKWVQTTNETNYIFNTFRTADHLRRLARRFLERSVGDGNGSDVLWAPRIPKHPKESGQQSPVDIDVEQKLDEIVTRKLHKQPSEPPEHSEGPQNEIDCDPDARCHSFF